MICSSFIEKILPPSALFYQTNNIVGYVKRATPDEKTLLNRPH